MGASVSASGAGGEDASGTGLPRGPLKLESAILLLLVRGMGIASKVGLLSVLTKRVSPRVDPGADYVEIEYSW
jgi:hypothetical protein